MVLFFDRYKFLKTKSLSLYYILILIFIFVDYKSVKFERFDLVNELSKTEGFLESIDRLSNKLFSYFLNFKLSIIGYLLALFFIEFNNFISYSFYLRF